MMTSDKFIVTQRRPAVGKSSVVSIRMPDKTIEQLEQIAGKTGRTRNELVLMCIDYALERLEISTD
ncbi:MAG: CopG family transcriptional regulator [Subdoligranulum sp.]|nr:CopG family transcriptional regulator [Subdoligranulum sp.]